MAYFNTGDLDTLVTINSCTITKNIPSPYTFKHVIWGGKCR